METLYFLVLIVINLNGFQSDSSGWGVNYTGSICAVRGSNVRIPCTYFYPSSHKVETVRWCSMNSNKEKCADPPYVYNNSSNSASEEFQYVGDKQSNCTLLISNVQFSHSAEYRFRFITNEKVGRWTGDPGVTLQVGDLQLTGPPENETLKKGDAVNLTCAVNCSLSSPQFVWFKDNQRLPSSDPVLHLPALTVEDSGNYSCALKTDEAVRSEMFRIHFKGVCPSGLVTSLVIVVGIVVIIALIFLAVVYNRRKKEKAGEESDGEKGRKTQIGESGHGEQTDPQTNQVTQSAEVLQQEDEQTYASVHKPKTGKKKKAQKETDGGSGRKTKVGNSAQSGLLQEDDVTYAAVSIKPTKPKERFISTVQLEEDDSVIYSAVATK
uniref:Sc:d156 n=1 Tax=Astyanax mexicanus TaxID=7994 RepID=A0A3B1JYE1_ASTMX